MTVIPGVMLNDSRTGIADKMMQMMNLNAWLTYIKQLNTKEIDLTLARVQTVANFLQLTRFSCPVVMVAGTNGKGSVVTALESIFSAAGYRVASYTSPKLFTLTEQIKIKQQPVTEDELVNALHVINNNRADLPLTEFEFITLAALYLIKQADCDLILLEVGMGGRDDAVNVVEPNISIITSIDLDHMQFLGETRDKIAAIKAGIFRSQKIAICGDPNPPQSLLDYAHKINTKLYLINKDFSYASDNESWYWNFKGICEYCQLPFGNIDLFNAAIALMAVKLLEDKMSVTKQAIYQGLDKATLPGRFQVIENEQIIIFDVAHNPAACENLKKKIQQRYPKHKIKALVGMLKDKDIKKSLLSMSDIIDSWYVASLNVERGAAAEKLTKILAENHITSFHAYDNLATAYQAASSELLEDEVLVVFGSFITVAECLALHKGQQTLCNITT